MTDEQFDNLIMHSLSIMCRFAKWYILQYILLFCMPFLWNDSLNIGLAISIAVYTLIFSIYREFVIPKKQIKFIYLPLFAYIIIIVLCCIIGRERFPSLWLYLFLPIYGIICLITGKLLKKYYRKHESIIRRTFLIISIIIVLSIFKIFSITWACNGHGCIEGEKTEIIQRRDYLVDKLIVSAINVLNEMPSGIGEQFKGEWALYSCSMFSAALNKISILYPETKNDNIILIDSLIQIVMSPEIREYDKARWGEDPLHSLDGNNSHISYLSHLAWMITGYKSLSNNTKYDYLLSSLCECMNRRLLKSPALNLETYPGEPIYIPDMLVAIVALHKYSQLYKGKYSSTVKEYLKRARELWCDKETGLLVSFLELNGTQIHNAPIKGSYSALNCYYLTQIDKGFANEQYSMLKTLFWKNSLISGLKEYYKDEFYIGLDMDAGPILFELSPTGTAFCTGSATFFNDTHTRTQILKTAEIAGHSILYNKKRHYLLANIALVGESIMLAMRTNYDFTE